MQSLEQLVGTAESGCTGWSRSFKNKIIMACNIEKNIELSWCELCRHWCHQWRQSWHHGSYRFNGNLRCPQRWRRVHHGNSRVSIKHDDVIKWKHFPIYWPFVIGIHRSPVSKLLSRQSRRRWFERLRCSCRRYAMLRISSSPARDACMCQWTRSALSSGNGKSPFRCQAITWTNAGVLSFGLPRTNFSDNNDNSIIFIQ